MAGALRKRVRRQVRAESRLRYGPQRAALRQAGRDVEDDYATDVAVANQTARGAKRAARAAQPSIRRTLEEALATTQAGPAPGASAALGNLGPAAARDAEGSRRRLSESMAAATTELDQRVVDAEAGRSSAVMQATSERKAGRKTLARQLRDLTGQAGTFRAARAGELAEAGRGRAVTRRGQDVTRANSRDRVRSQDQRSAAQLEETKRHNRAAEKNAAAGGGQAKATLPRREAASSALALARAQAQRLKAAGRGREEVKPLLVEGRESQTLDDPKSPGAKIKVPGVKKVNEIWAAVALDIEFDGEISKRNLKRLRALGYGANMLGVGKFRPTKDPEDYPQSKARAPVQR